MNPVVRELLERSNRLGADPRTTNYAGGNTSAKGTDVDPATGAEVELLWVKGSGGDLGTLTEAGLAVLRLDRLRSLVDVYPGEEREDEMVATFDFCRHGLGGATPSIDTAMHGLVEVPHVDHLHPDSGIAIAASADGARLTKDVYGDRVVWIPWRRPGFQLGLSSHAPDQAQRAIAAGADYVAIGPVFATGTKPGRMPVTLDYVRWAAANVSIPWFAIGGITLQNLDQVLAAGAKRICVVSAILNAADIPAACREFKRRLGGS